MKTVQQLASELCGALEQNKRNDESEFYALKKDSPQWMTDVIRAVHGDKLPDDTVYEMINRAAGALVDADESLLLHDPDGDDLREAIYQIEPDIYTSDLTAWLHASTDHVFHINSVLSEFGGDIKDGFQLLQLAQKAQIEEIGYALLDALVELAKAEIEEETE